MRVSFGFRAFPFLLLPFVSLSSHLCFAEAQFSIVRDVDRGGERGTQSIALFCTQDEPALKDCRVFRARGAVAEKTKTVSPEVAREILSAGADKLAPRVAATPAPARSLTPASRFRWTLVYSGKTYSGGADLSYIKSLMTLESRLNHELDRP